MQELGALRVRGVLEDGAALAPGGEEAVLGDGDVEGRGGGHAGAAAEGRGVGAVGLADECHRSGSAADPAGSLGEQLLEPVEAVLPKAVVLWLVAVSRTCSRVLGFNSRQVEGKKNSIVVVGMCEDQLVLELRLQVIRILHRPVLQLVCIPDITPTEYNNSVPSPPGVAEFRVDFVEVQRFISQECALLIPTRIVVNGLEDDTVNVDIALYQLLVDVTVVILGYVDSDVECHAGESFLEGRLQ